MRFVTCLGAAALLATSACIFRGPVGFSGPRYASATGCPFGISGVRVDPLETDEGIDVVLTTSGGGSTMDELRNRAHYALQGKTEPGMTAPAGVRRVPPLRTPAHVDVEDVNDGVAIRVSAEEHERVDDVRDEIYDRIEAVEDSDICK